ncbi:MAG: tetratricopeptide repeat protein [Candidatus Lokiarchaeota archaeon]|nr:tetratricopeptide repeat protein [Candidatus Lokiarchaeota archaeon]
MSSTTIKYPSEEIISTFNVNKDFEYIILWMLHNNDRCRWADFKANPLNISQASLSKYLKLMIANDQILREKKGEYKITPEGRKHYIEIQLKDSLTEQLNYPPEVILRRRNYDHIILWMLYNNNVCKWSDFFEEPLSINNSSLSKNLGLLKASGLIDHDISLKEYRITKKGEAKFFSVLKRYDLDRQSILEEESKRIEVITDKVSKFFSEYEIESDEIKYRFLNIVLRLDYTQIENTLANENELNKIMLFLSLNHPDQYPDYISVTNFSLKYNIKPTTLKFFLEKIVKEEGYPIKFFELEVSNDITYYIQAEEKLEKLLNVIVEDHIRKFTYLNKLNKKEGVDNSEINALVELIANEICTNVFNENLKPSMNKFLPEFIENLAYKFESEKSLITQDDKTKGVIYQKFQNVFEVIQSFGTSEAASSASKPIDNEAYYFLHNRIFDTLDIIYLSKIDFFRIPEFKKAYFSKNSGFLSAIEEKMSKGSLSKASELLTDNIINLSDIELMILRDIIYTSKGELEDSLELTQKIIEKYPDEYVGYLFQSETYFLMGKFKDALSVVELGLTNAFDVLLITQKAQILISYDHSKAVETIDEVIEDYPENFALLRTKFLTVMTDKECCIGPIAAPRALIESLIDEYPDNFELKVLKGLLYIVNHQYQEAKNWIKESIKPDISENNPRIDIASYLIRTYSYLARGKFEKALKYVRIAQFHYPNHPISHIMTGLVHGFNIVYKFDPKKENKELFREGFKKAISMQQSEKKLSRYYQLECLILNETDGFDEAVNAIDKAIELSPEHFDIYNTKAHIYLALKDKQEEVFKFYDELYEKFPHEDKDIRKMKSFSHYSFGNLVEGINILEESLEIYPGSIGMLNNLAVFLSYSGRFDEAIEAIEKAIEIDPNEANLYDTYGEILLLANDYKGAIEKFVQALDMSPTGWFAFHSFLKLSKSYKALGMMEEARTCYEKAEILTEKVLPGKRKMYMEQLDEIIEELGKVPIQK